MELHARRLDELLLGGAAIALKIDHRLHAEGREVAVVLAVRLSPAVVAPVDLAEVINVDPCGPVAREGAIDRDLSAAIPTTGDRAIAVVSTQVSNTLFNWPIGAPSRNS